MTTSVGTHTQHTAITPVVTASTTANTLAGGPAADIAPPGADAITTDANALGGPAGNAVAGVANISSELKGVLQGLVGVLQKLVEYLQSAGGGNAGSGCGMAGCDMGGMQHGVKGMAGEAAPAAIAAPAPMYIAPAPVAVQASSGEDNAYEQRVLQLVNAERAKEGLGAVVYNARLDSAAEKHNVLQAQQRTMAHLDIGDGDPGTRIRNEGFTAAWGENVAVGQKTPEQVVSEWMASPTHRKNIMDPRFTQMGVSFEQTADGFPFWAQSFGA